MLKKIMIVGTGMMLSLCTPVLASDMNDLNKVEDTGFIESVEVDKAIADKEITVYKDPSMTETVGKLFENNIADIKTKNDNLLEIQSGDVEGYVKAEEIKTEQEAKDEILKDDIKGVIAKNVEITPVKSKDLLKPYTEEKESVEIKEGEEYTVKNYGNKIIIEKDNEIFSLNPEDINIDFQRPVGKTDEVIEAERKEAEDTEAANSVMSLFDMLADDIEISDKSSIEDARNAYNNLTEDQKKKVTTLSTLENAENELQQEEQRIEEEKRLEEQRRIEEEKRLEEQRREEENVVYNVDYNVDTTGWAEGIASAYGGYSDPSVAPGARTATGAPCTETSMGVAVPMSWPNYRSLFGHQVLISWGGKTVTATINDCGGMGNGSRSLDLQPGVFKAFGFSNCQDWGLKTVKYKIL